MTGGVAVALLIRQQFVLFPHKSVRALRAGFH